MPELPHQRRERYLGLGLSMYDVLVLSDDVGAALFFDGVLEAGAPAKPAANWVMGDVMAYCKVSSGGGPAAAWLGMCVMKLSMRVVAKVARCFAEGNTCGAWAVLAKCSC